MATDEHAPSTSEPACYLIVYNVSKKHNIGTLSRAATAFNVKEVRSPGSGRSGGAAACRSERRCSPVTAAAALQICLVGSKHFNVFGSQGSDAHVSVCHYNTIEECCADLRENKGG